MQSIKLKRLIYRVRHDLMTTNNIVLAVALVIAFSWAWSSVEAVQRNYLLQSEVDAKRREKKLTELETETLQFEQRFYQSDEYKELEVKRRLGLAKPGERVLILPPNSTRAKLVDQVNRQEPAVAMIYEVPPTPMEQWVEFLFGDKPSF